MLIALAIIFILCGVFLQYKVKGTSSKGWVNYLIGAAAAILVIAGIMLITIVMV
jgi:hypothetical protein